MAVHHSLSSRSFFHSLVRSFSPSVLPFFSAQAAVTFLPVVRQKYEVQVRDAYVLAGNTGVLRCEIPPFVKEYVAVTSWFQDSAFNIYPTAESGKCNYAGLRDPHES